MKKLVFTFFILFLTHWSFSQQVSIDWSDCSGIPDDGGSYKNHFFVPDFVLYDEGVMIAKANQLVYGEYRDQLVLEIYDQDNNLVQKKNWGELSANDEQLYFYELVNIGAQFYVIAYIPRPKYTRNFKDRKMYFAEVDKVTLAKKGDWQLLYTFPDGDIDYYRIRQDRENDFLDGEISGYRIKQDKGNNFLAFIYKQPVEDEEKAKYDVIVYGKGMQQVCKKSWQLSYFDQGFKLDDIAVDDHGAVYVWGKAYRKLDNYKSFHETQDHKPNFNYVLYKLNKDTEENYDIKTGDRFLNNTRLIIKNGILYFIGLTTTHNGWFGEYPFEGYYYLKLNQSTLEKKSEKFYDLSEEEVALYSGKDNPAKYRLAHVMRNVYVYDDGSLLFLTEYQNTDDQGVLNLYNIAVLRLSEIGELESIKRISKQQEGPAWGDVPMQFGSFMKGDKIILIFNDDDKNLTEVSSENPQRFKSTKFSSFVAVIINKDGSMKKKELLNKDNVGDKLPSPILDRQGNSAAYIFSQTKDHACLGKIVIK